MNAIAAEPAEAKAGTGDICFHCGEVLPADPPRLALDGATRGFCCTGCATAAAWVRDAGLDDYYRLRDAAGNRVDAVAGDYASWDRADVQAGHVVANDRGREITVVLEGLRCAACAWLVDRALSREPGVASVGVNAVTGRLRLAWDPTRTRLSALLARVAALGYRPHLAGGAALERERLRERNALLMRMGLAALVATQSMMLSEALYLDTTGQMPVATRDFFRWLTFLTTTPVVFYAGWPLLAGMARELRERSFGMDTLAGSSILLAYVASLVETLRGGPHVWYDAAAMFVLFLLAARLLERFARQRASARLDLLARAQPALAWREAGGRREQCPVHELKAGDVVHVAPRETVPADGELLDDTGAFDESLLTGEAVAIAKRRGDPVLAGSLCLQQGARLQVTETGSATRLSQVQRLVERAQAQRPRLARLADHVASRFVLVMFALALAALAYWWPQGPDHAFGIALAVLVAACPCALSLAVPAALSAANEALARHGVLAVGSEALERLALVDVVLLDKTGTLTTGAPRIASVETFDGTDRERALALAAALESGGTHPLAAALLRANAPAASGQRVHPGRGIEGVVDGRGYRLGTAPFSHGGSDDGAVWLGDGERPLARFAIGETVRPEAAGMVSALRRLGLQVAVASGDGEAAVSRLCDQLGIADFHARQAPEQKLAELERRQRLGQRVLMLGDGVNDAPVLAGADLSMAMASGASLAQRAADLLLMGQNLARLPEAIALARRTRRVMRQNLAWAAAYNVVAVAIAAAGWVHPGLAALGMAASSLLVSGNALRLSRGRDFAA